MLQKDKTKAVVAIAILLAIAVSYLLFGKDVAKYVTLFGFTSWLFTMYQLNKRE